MNAQALRPGLPPLPARWLTRPLDHRGYPVPWFVAWVNGRPDFRIIDSDKLPIAIKQRRCWCCGEILGKFLSFCLGPMCAITRTIGEPPSHRECIEWSARACPWLSLPKAKRREHNVPDGSTFSEFGLRRNPGVVLVWTTRSYTTFRDGQGGLLFSVGDPLELSWICEGRTATRAEIMESITTGLPHLEAIALAEGVDAYQQLEKQKLEVIEKLVPKE